VRSLHRESQSEESARKRALGRDAVGAEPLGQPVQRLGAGRGQPAPGARWALPGRGAEPGSDVPPGPAWVASGVVPVVADGIGQPELARARRPQLHPVALRHAGHLDLRTLVPPGTAPPCSRTEVAVVRSANHGSRVPSWSSLRIPIGFIITIRRLVRVSWLCRSRYATSGARSRPTGPCRRPGAAPPAGPGRPSRPPRGSIRQDR
jgi:hypothetical protein